MKNKRKLKIIKINTLTFTEKQGINAVIKLQGMVTIKESKENARKIWNSFSDGEKLQTQRAYETFYGASQN